MSAPKRCFKGGPNRNQLMWYKTIFFMNGYVPGAIFTVEMETGQPVGLAFEQIEVEPLVPNESIWGFRGLAIIGPIGEAEVIPVEGLVNVETNEGHFCRLPHPTSEAVQQAIQNAYDEWATEIAHCDL